MLLRIKQQFLSNFWVLINHISGLKRVIFQIKQAKLNFNCSVFAGAGELNKKRSE